MMEDEGVSKRERERSGPEVMFVDEKLLMNFAVNPKRQWHSVASQVLQPHIRILRWQPLTLNQRKKRTSNEIHVALARFASRVRKETENSLSIFDSVDVVRASSSSHHHHLFNVSRPLCSFVRCCSLIFSLRFFLSYFCRLTDRHVYIHFSFTHVHFNLFDYSYATCYSDYYTHWLTIRNDDDDETWTEYDWPV